MNKTMKMMLALVAGAMMLTACSSEDILENIETTEVAQDASQLKPMTFTAVQEGQGSTRVAIDGLAINWTANDKICIFDGATENCGVQEFTLATGEGSTSATFSGSAATASTYYALYPYAAGEILRQVTKAEAKAIENDEGILESWRDQINQGEEEGLKESLTSSHISEENQAIILAYLKNEPIRTPGVALVGSTIKNVVIPAEQTATAGSADPQAMIMVAKGDDTDALQFKNVCAYVKVTPQFNCHAISLVSKGTEQIAGKVDVNYNDGEPTTTVTAEGTNTVSLVGTITAGSAYYIAVRPEALTTGFTIEFLTTDKNTYYARSTSNALNLARSNVKNLGEFATSGTWTHNGLATKGDAGDGHSWVLLTPTIKMATAHAGDQNDYKFAEILSWGSTWVLPTRTELEYLRANGAFNFDGSNNLSLVGMGVLKYAVNIEIESTSNGFWSSTPGSTADKQWAVSDHEGFYEADKTTSMGAVYVYKNNN